MGLHEISMLRRLVRVEICLTPSILRLVQVWLTLGSSRISEILWETVTVVIGLLRGLRFTSQSQTFQSLAEAMFRAKFVHSH